MKKSEFYRLVNSSWRIKAYLLWKLPGAWFMGVGLKSCDAEQAQVTMPYGWRSQNPFKSTYFAAQCAAGEFSTGILALGALCEQPPVSMLVTKISAEFYKKADKTLLFTCHDGAAISAAVAQTLATGEAVEYTAISVGTLPDGTVASKVFITWSFKSKKQA
jgi:Domain of unknown function (DUF4442)